MKKLLLRSLLFLFAITALNIDLIAQDPLFSQFYNNPTYHNPAYVGLTKGLKARLHYRRQWENNPANFNTYNFSADIADRDLPGAGGIGMLVNQESNGVGYEKVLTAGFIPSIRIPIAKNFVMQAAPIISYVRREIDWDNLIFSGQLDDINGNINPSTFSPPNNNAISYPDFSFGILFQVLGENSVATFGAAGHHLTEPNQSFFEGNSPMKRRYVAHGDIIYEVGNYKGYFKRKVSFKINPGLIYMSQASLTTYAVGLNVYLSNMYFGAWYRNETLEYDSFSDFIAMGGILIPIGKDSRMKLMYSYDMQINASYAFTGPSHEVSLIFELDDLKLLNTNDISRFRGRELNMENLECSPF